MSQDRKIKRGNSKCTRRQFGLALGTISLTLTTTAGKMMAGKSLQSSELSLEESLQIALRAIGSDVANTAADHLAKSAISSAALNLHLRNAQMTASDVKLIANALDRTTVSELARLVSFSLSYNAIGDEGASTLAASLPATLTELGLVGCSIGDQGGGAILEWAKYANGLRMICIEDNSMSDQMRKQFGSLRDMSVFV
jgi:hypothetical protein